MKRTTSTRNIPDTVQTEPKVSLPESDIKFGTSTQPPVRIPPSIPVPVQLPPKRKCSEAQLKALAAGRAKNPKFKPKDRSEPPF